MKVFTKQACRFVREVPGVPHRDCESVSVGSAVVTEVPAWVRETRMWEMLTGKSKSMVILEDPDSGLTLDEGLAAYPQVSRYLKNPGNNVTSQNAIAKMQF